MKLRFAPFRPNVMFIALLLGVVGVYALHLGMESVVGIAVGALAVGFGKLSD